MPEVYHRCELISNLNQCQHVAGWRVARLSTPDEWMTSCDEHVTMFLDFTESNIVEIIEPKEDNDERTT